MPETNNNLKLPAIQEIEYTPFCANSSCDLPSSTSLIRYYHVTAGFPVKEAWYKSMSNGNYSAWLGLAVELVRICCPGANETIVGTMSQKKNPIN